MANAIITLNGARQLPRRACGFTLLEVVVVLAMIAVLTGVAVSMLHFDRGEQRLQDTAGHIVQGYRAMRDEALLSNRPGRLRLTAENRLTAEVRSTNRVVFVSDETVKVMELTTVDGVQVSLMPPSPIYFFPDGQTTPFRLTLSLDNGNIAQIVQGDAMGRVTLKSL